MVEPKAIETIEKTSSDETDSPCGPGTIFDSETNSCVLGSATEKTSSDETDSPWAMFWKLIHVFR